MARKSGLGKGLEALFEDNSSSVGENGQEMIKISEISPNKDQPRKEFDLGALEQLADSIREHGVIQPLILRPLTSGGYQIVAGERRYRASRMAGLTELPAIIRDFSDQEAMEVALIENLQREDLNPIEEALGYQELMEQYGFTQETVSKSVGKSRPAVANALRLLNLPQSVRNHVQNGDLSAGHARAILSLNDEKLMEETAQRVMQKGMTVREIEKLAKSEENPKKEKRVFPKGDSFYEEMELALSSELGRKVKVQAQRKKGSITIEFYGKEDLKELAGRLEQLAKG